jgi:hypothetical protein
VAHRGASGRALVASALLAAAVLTACSGGSDGSKPAAEQRRTPTASPTTAYPTGAPTGTVLTDPGSDLAFGEGATVTWNPRQGVVGTVRISVGKVERTTFKKSFLDWRVDARMKTYTPYFVHARVTNAGPADLGGAPVPLYGESDADALVEPAVFKETFKPCHPSALPKPFAAGASARVCLVYLVPNKGALVGAAFRPTQDFNPIVWEQPVPSLTPVTSPPAQPASPTVSASP